MMLSLQPNPQRATVCMRRHMGQGLFDGRDHIDYQLCSSACTTYRANFTKVVKPILQLKSTTFSRTTRCHMHLPMCVVHRKARHVDFRWWCDGRRRRPGSTAEYSRDGSPITELGGRLWTCTQSRLRIISHSEKSVI